jgi:hypothetical protein
MRPWYVPGVKRGGVVIPQFSEDFAWWIVKRLMDEAILEHGIKYADDWGDSKLYKDKDIQDAIRRILMESEKKRRG